MDGGRLRRPPLINYQFYIKQIIKIYRKTYKKCKNMQKYTKYGRGAVQISQTMGPSRGTHLGIALVGVLVFWCFSWGVFFVYF